MSRGTVNKVILIGRLGKDPDLRYAPSGTAIASFTMATNHATKDAEGAWVEQTEWHSVTTFGRQAEFCGEYLKKGRQVFVEGRLRTSSWEDQSGQKRFRTEIVANEIQLLGSKVEGEKVETPPAVQQGDVSEPAPPPEPPMQEDDLPF